MYLVTLYLQVPWKCAPEYQLQGSSSRRELFAFISFWHLVATVGSRILDWIGLWSESGRVILIDLEIDGVNSAAGTVIES